MRTIQYKCDGCDRPAQGSYEQDINEHLVFKLPSGWANKTNEQGEFDLCPMCLDTHTRNMNPRQWAKVVAKAEMPRDR